MHQTWEQGGYLISTDPDWLDQTVIFDFLANRSYWAQGLTRDRLARSIAHALCFGVYQATAVSRQQVGFARVITDLTTMAYVSDVFILEPFRGQGLSKWLMACILAHPDLQGLRRWMLNTRDAHTLYGRFGFAPDPYPQNCLVMKPPQSQSVESGVSKKGSVR